MNILGRVCGYPATKNRIFNRRVQEVRVGNKQGQSTIHEPDLTSHIHLVSWQNDLETGDIRMEKWQRKFLTKELFSHLSRNKNEKGFHLP